MPNYLRYEGDPPRKERQYKYPWASHVRYLRMHPNEWVRLEEEISVGAVNEVRTGKQKDMRKLLPHLKVVTRNNRTTPDGRSVCSMVAMYTPDEAVKPRTYPPLSDEQVRAARLAYARGEKSGTALAREYGVKGGSMYTLLNGLSRREAGGPYGATKEEREAMLAEIEMEEHRQRRESA